MGKREGGKNGTCAGLPHIRIPKKPRDSGKFYVQLSALASVSKLSKTRIGSCCWFRDGLASSLVLFADVAAKVHGLEVPRCGGVAAIDQGNDVIQGGAEWMAGPETEEDGLAAPCADGTFDAVLGDEPTPWSAGPSPLRVPLAECHAPTPLGTRKAPTCSGWSLSLVTRMPLHQ